jgi:hypothetical protein
MSTAITAAQTHDPASISARLEKLASECHLVTPATQVDVMPEGFGVSVTLVKVDPRDCYKLAGGKLGLSGVSLLQIASAAGVNWLPRESGRLDDGSDPHYVHYRAVGMVRLFDGTCRAIFGEVEMDARDGSPLVDEIITKAERAQPKRDPASQILELRKFLLRHAETRAKLRATASLGLKRSYDQIEIQKPFAVARLVFTGATSDPELRKEFAILQAKAALSAAQDLYGQPAPALPATTDRLGHAPPPISVVDTTGESSSVPWEES